MSKELEAKLDAALDAIDVLNEKVQEYDDKFANLSQNVNSLEIKSVPKQQRVIADPGVVIIDKVKYRFVNLAFRVSSATEGLVKHYAEDVAKDASLCAKLLAEHPSVFEKV